jgi:hypothetical protein
VFLYGREARLNSQDKVRAIYHLIAYPIALTSRLPDDVWSAGEGTCVNFLDWQGAAGSEEAALQTRQQYLATLAARLRATPKALACAAAEANFVSARIQPHPFRPRHQQRQPLAGQRI